MPTSLSHLTNFNHIIPVKVWSHLLLLGEISVWNWVIPIGICEFRVRAKNFPMQMLLIFKLQSTQNCSFLNWELCELLCSTLDLFLHKILLMWHCSWEHDFSFSLPSPFPLQHSNHSAALQHPWTLTGFRSDLSFEGISVLAGCWNSLVHAYRLKSIPVTHLLHHLTFSLSAFRWSDRSFSKSLCWNSWRSCRRRRGSYNTLRWWTEGWRDRERTLQDSHLSPLKNPRESFLHHTHKKQI